MSFAPIGAIVALGIPALLVAKLPRRGLPAAITLWTLSPAIAFFALELIGKMLGTPTQPQTGSFGNSLLLAGSFLLIPWILMCLAGFGMGFAIRNRIRKPRDLASGHPDQPLSAPAQAVKETWHAPHTSPPQYRHISSDGTIQVDLASQEWSNGNWVNAPRVIEIASGRILLDLWGTDWDATVSFHEIGRVRLDCRRAHVGGGLSVMLDIPRHCYQITVAPGPDGVLPEQPLDSIAEGLEAASRRSAQASHPFPIPTHPLAAWPSALLLLIGAAVLIAIASYLSTRHQPTHSPRTPIPHLPASSAH